MQDWPYPKLFCHRLGGALGPENTLGAMQKAIALGVRAVECDVKLSADRVPFVLHDDTLERTTNGQGLAGALSMSALLALDAGISHHPAFAGEPLPTLARLAEQALARIRKPPRWWHSRQRNCGRHQPLPHCCHPFRTMPCWRQGRPRRPCPVPGWLKTYRSMCWITWLPAKPVRSMLTGRH